MSLVVVGDALLDRDLTGTVDRLCPDAPVPVVDSPVDVPRPGGAGLAALLAAPPAGAAAPAVRQMVVFRDGDAVTRTVKAKQVSVRVGRRSCAAGEGTALVVSLPLTASAVRA